MFKGFYYSIEHTNSSQEKQLDINKNSDDSEAVHLLGKFLLFNLQLTDVA